jgi:hypothetical protein
MYTKPDNQIKSLYYLKNREKILLKMKKYQDIHRFEMREYNRNYYAKNRNKLNDLHKKYSYERYHGLREVKYPQKKNNKVDKPNDVDEIKLNFL